MGEEGREAPFFLSFEKEVFSFPLSLIPPHQRRRLHIPDPPPPPLSQSRKYKGEKPEGKSRGWKWRSWEEIRLAPLRGETITPPLLAFFSFNEGQYGEGGHPFLLLPSGLGTGGALLHAPKHSTDRKEERERCFLSQVSP